MSEKDGIPVFDPDERESLWRCIDGLLALVEMLLPEQGRIRMGGVIAEIEDRLACFHPEYSEEGP